MIVKAWLTLTVVALLWFRGTYLVAIFAALVGLLWALRDYRSRRGTNVVFCVQNDRVSVELRDGKSLDFALDDLLEVQLDTRARSKNVTMARGDGLNTIFGAASNLNIDIDVSRIELVFEDNKTTLLDQEFISALLATDHMRSIRLFLRAHGWKPIDERQIAEDEAS